LPFRQSGFVKNKYYLSFSATFGLEKPIFLTAELFYEKRGLLPYTLPERQNNEKKRWFGLKIF
jgi:hypothetical protein